MKKTIIFLAILAIFAYGCETQQDTGTTEELPPPPEPEKRFDLTNIVGDYCLGLEGNDKTDCENKEVMRVAIRAQDENTCTLIVSEVVQQICMDNVLNVRAISEKSSELCNLIVDEGMKEGCLASIA